LTERQQRRTAVKRDYLEMSASRDRVVSAALKAFAQDGYNGVSMRDLGYALGIRAPSLYSHFPSKADLLAACLEPLMTRIDGLLSQAPAVPATSVEIEAWLTEVIRALAEQPEAARILLTDPAMRRVMPLTARLDEETYRLLAMLEVFGMEDRITATATFGAMFFPVAQGIVTEESAPELARTITRLLQPEAAAASTIMSTGSAAAAG
jgi:AcrR family transcriptional regulator